MKKALESWKLWTLLSALIFIMTCGLMTYAATGGTKFSTWKVSIDWGKLTSLNWNSLMENLDSQTVPQGAIVAFVGRTICPDGWTRYSDADGRFLMWASSSIWSKWWTNSIALVESNLPSHSHYIRYGWSADDYWDNANRRAVVVDWSTNKYPWSNNGTKTAIDWNTTENIWRYTVSTSSVWNWYYWSSIDITNPYVKVLFCKKN